MKKNHTRLINELKLHDTPVSSTELAQILKVTSRSIKNYVKEINAQSPLIEATKNGYLLRRHNPIPAYKAEDFPETTEERSFYIIRELLLQHREPLEIFDLCDELALGYSTIKTLIARMNKSFMDYEVSFYTRDDCILTKGTEEAKRKLIRYVISSESKSSFKDLSKLKEYFPDTDVDQLVHLIQTTFRKHQYYLNDFAAMNMILHLLIMLEREQYGETAESLTAPFEYQNSSEKNLILDLCTILQQDFGMPVNDAARESVGMLVRSNTNPEQSSGDFNPETTELVSDIITYIDNIYHIDLSSPTFRNPFQLHLGCLLVRVRRNQFIDNPMSAFIRQNNPTIFEIAAWISMFLQERLAITLNESEIAFLALHIGSEVERQSIDRNKVSAVLVCPDYRDMRSLILNQLMLEFNSQMRVLTTVSSEQEIPDNEFAIILTTLPLYKKYTNPVIQISPLDIKKQRNQIEDAIDFMNTRYLRKTVNENFDRFFQEKLFIREENFTDKKAVLKQLNNLLLTIGCVEDDFLADVWQRENAASTCFGKIAIPHSIHMDAIQTGVAVAVCPEGIQWGDNLVEIVLLLAINKADQHKFQVIYESLIDLFSEPEVLQKLRKCQTYSEFRDFLFPLLRQSEF